MHSTILIATLFIASIIAQNSTYVPDPTKWRPIDGYGHNPFYPLWGTPGIQLLRKGPAFYDDDISSPRTALYSGNPLPSPRLISDNVFKNPGTIPKSRRGLNDFLTYWGQFIDHDFTLTSGDPHGFASPVQSLPISVPKGDAYFDPAGTGTVTLPFYRGVKDNTTGINNPDLPWTPINLVTAWMDGSQIYGSDNVTAACLRTFSGGLLKSQFIGGQEYPVFNNGTCPGILMQTANIASQNQLFLFGDVRGNENPGLTAIQIIFLREHNRRAIQLAGLYPTWTDEELYQESRKFVIAIIDHITEEEYLPITLGEHFEEFTTTNFQEAPNIFADFSTGGFRYGHSEVNSEFIRLDSNGFYIPQGSLELLSSYFNPIQSILSAGLDPILRGMLRQSQGAVDVIFVDDLRNYLFGSPGAGGMDLTAINIQRGRDHGLPGFNTFRDNYGLPPYTSWSQINPDPNVWQSLANTYESIDDCDIYVCGLAEVPYNSMANVGQTFHAIIKDQYHRLRDSDPFWYEADGYLTVDEEAAVRQTTLAELIQRNSGLQPNEVQCLAMSLPDGCAAPITPPVATQPYDFVVTLQNTSASNPLFGLENDISFAINGTDGATLTLQRGRSYTFFTQISCSHAFYIATTPDITIPPFAPAYPNVTNQYSCLQQGTYLTLVIDDSTPSELFYQCALHNFMGGNITIVNGPTSGSIITPPTTQATASTQSTPSLPVTSSAAPIIQTNNNGVAAGTIVSAVVIPILVVIIVILVFALWSVSRRKPAAASGMERRGSKVELEER